MRSIVPIIGHEFVDNHPDLKSWAEFLVYDRGFEIIWVSETSITKLQTSKPEEIFVPLIIRLLSSENQENHVHFTQPIAQHFKTSPLISTTVDSLASTIFNLGPHFSLWEIKNPGEIIRKTIAYIFHHITEADITVSSIAREIGVSKNTLESRFEKAYGTGVKHFLKRIRLRQAKRILIESNSSVANIASAVGYFDFRSFDRAFRNEWGQTPLQCRKFIFGQNDTFAGQ